MEPQTDKTKPMLLIIGAYTDSLPHVQAKGTGISLLSFDPDTGIIAAGPTYSDIRNPTYLAVSKDQKRLYAVEELSETDGADIIVFSLDAAGGQLSPLATVPAHGDWPCHVSFDLTERRLFVSNYLSGTFATYALGDDGLPKGGGVTIKRTGTGPNLERQEGPHVHQGVPTPDGLHVLLCDAGTDEIARHSLTGSLIETQPNLVVRTAGGSLPRHLAFAPDGKRFFVVHELGCCVNSYAYGADEIRLLATASALPEAWSGESNCATIRAHPNGKFVFASNRGHNSIVVFDVSGPEETLRATGWYSTRGETPRDFNIDPSGRFLIAANQDGHSLAAFAIDGQTGALTAIGDTYAIGSPVCVLFA